MERLQPLPDERVAQLTDIARNGPVVVALAQEVQLSRSLESRVAEWVRTRLGADHMRPCERAMRLLEEAIELAQAEGVPMANASALVAHVYARAAGEPAAEGAGAAVTLLGWCASRGARFLNLAIAELERIEARPAEEIRDSLARKARAGLVMKAEDMA